ncbi:MAG: stage II sporulation protein R [Ruminococcaceae bacterium]|nr:stage II sporulation protein R [Oscillospiraceae bacterium]
MRMFLKSLALGTVAAMMLSFCHFYALCGDIREGVVRLHVLAHDDTKEEQDMKLAVRDAVLVAADGLLDGVEDTEQALAAVTAALPRLERAANICLRERGSSHTAAVTLQPTYFTTRTYDAGTLPAGWYNALRVVIGDGAGRNWWCVVFPPLCVSSAVKPTRLEDVLDEEACDVVENAPRYEVRFKMVEWVSGWFGR